jgi:hypothetical protein
MYGKTPKVMAKQTKMPAAKKTTTPKMPVRGQRAMTNKMAKAKK